MCIKKILLLLYICFFSSNLCAGEKTNRTNFEPHEAIYHLSIGNISNSSKIHNVLGEMHLTIKSVCDGWVVNQNTTIDVTDKNGSQLRNIFRYSIWESKNHDKLKFMSKMIVNGEEVSSYEGKAFIQEGIGKIIYVSPHNKVIDIPVDTLFPMKHFFITLYDANIESFDNYTVFTGEDSNSLSNISSFSKKSIDVDSMYKVIRSANYDYFKNSIKPESEIEVTVNSESGVVKKVIFDYFDYQILGELKDTNYYSKPEC